MPSQETKGHSRNANGDTAFSSAPKASRSGDFSHRSEPAQAPSSVLDGDRSFSRGQPLLDSRAVAERAAMNTKDTSVVERYAPGQLYKPSLPKLVLIITAVVHETVHKDIHHVREELIRREIHTHDVYHRVLPVIDVEVLPARHFLPVEGGGLVEISADEVPGRKNNWVLAETVSEIASDQAAPQSRANFTARAFPGREGDEARYVDPEGHEKTEQTWVHPPELETGARDTGQSWPMVFGGDAPEKGTNGYKSPKSSKSRSSKHIHMGSSASK